MRRLGAAVALSTAFLYGCGTSGEQLPGQPSSAPSAGSSVSATEAPTLTPTTPTVPPQPTFEQEKADLISSFDAVQGYWATQGVDISGTQLVIIEDGQSADACGATRSGDEAGGYCRSYDTVFFTQETLEYISSIAMLPRTPYEVPRMEVVAAHELGHAVQYAAGDTPTVQTYQANPRIYENQADCYAGRAVHAISPGLGAVVMSAHFQYLPGSDAGQPGIYGTTAEREAEFVSGFGGGPCMAGQ